MTDKQVVAVTEREFLKAEAIFLADEDFRCIPVASAEPACAQALAESGARHIILGADRYAGPLYGVLAPGAVVARFGVGYDGVDLDQATERGLLCTNTPGVLDDSVAELAMALIACAARPLARCIGATRTGSWEAGLGVELRSKTLAVVGCGGIGSRLARIAALGYGMRVIGCRTRLRGASVMKRDYGFAEIHTEFDDAVPGADFVSLHLPSNEDTRHFLDAARLAALKPGAWVINTARGAILDENALFDAVAGGMLGGAVLDVFQVEPYAPLDPDRDLRTLPNVLMTPHIGSATAEACDRMALRALENIRLAEAGNHDAMDLLNPQVLSRKSGFADIDPAE